MVSMARSLSPAPAPLRLGNDELNAMHAHDPDPSRSTTARSMTHRPRIRGTTVARKNKTDDDMMGIVADKLRWLRLPGRTT